MVHARNYSTRAALQHLGPQIPEVVWWPILRSIGAGGTELLNAKATRSSEIAKSRIVGRLQIDVFPFRFLLVFSLVCIEKTLSIVLIIQ